MDDLKIPSQTDLMNDKECNKKKTVMVGTSGGVDSSVAAALLLEQGYDVTAVTLKLWDGHEEELDSLPGNSCCSLDDIEDARKVSFKLGIPHYVLNFKDVFKESVINYFVRTYKEGRTPNPCIACNKYIKMSGMLDKALSMGFDYIATGHYAGINFNTESGRYELHRGYSVEKDQSYALYNFTQKQLAHTLLPLGNMEKSGTRDIARKYSLEIAEKPDSQEICFVENDDYISFIEKYTNEKLKPGLFKDKNGNILGEHKGIAGYTIGQRKGIGINLNERMYVTKKDFENNVVILGKKEDLYTDTLFAEDLNFIKVPAPEYGMRVEAKIRYNSSPEPAVIYPESQDCVKVVFDKPVRAVTPGQAVVFYDGINVVGGGTII